MLSRLEAINEMLTSVGEQVILVEVAGAGDYANCSAVLDAETKKALAKGWFFNTEYGVALAPDNAGRIIVPESTLSAKPEDPNLRISQRGNALYDLAKHTDVFTTPVVITRIVALPFEQCPYHVQREIVGRACQRYQRSYVGSKQLDDFAAEERMEAAADSRDNEVDEDDYNILNNPDLWYLRRRTYRSNV